MVPTQNQTHRTWGIWKLLCYSLRDHCHQYTPSWQLACNLSSQWKSLLDHKNLDLYLAPSSCHPPLDPSCNWIVIRYSHFTIFARFILWSRACFCRQSCNPCKWDLWGPCPSSSPPPGPGSLSSCPCMMLSMVVVYSVFNMLKYAYHILSILNTLSVLSILEKLNISNQSRTWPCWAPHPSPSWPAPPRQGWQDVAFACLGITILLKSKGNKNIMALCDKKSSTRLTSTSLAVLFAWFFPASPRFFKVKFNCKRHFCSTNSRSVWRTGISGWNRNHYN